MREALPFAVFVGVVALAALFGAQFEPGSWLFFGLERADLALIEIAVLLLALIATSASFLRVRTAAGLLLLPYVAWVAFAAYLNAGLWLLNR